MTDARATPAQRDADWRLPRIALRLIGGAPWLVPPWNWTVQYVLRPAIAPVPNVRPWLLGAYADRGQIVPVFDLARWLGAADDGATLAIAVLTQENRRLGLRVHAEPQVVTTLRVQDADRVEWQPPAPLAAHLGRRAHTEHGAMHEFDPWDWIKSHAESVVAYV